MASTGSFKIKKKKYPNEIRETRSSITISQSFLGVDDNDDNDDNNNTRSMSPPPSYSPPLTSFSDDESIFKGQKYFRLKDLLESSSLECLKDDDTEVDEAIPSSSLSSSQGSRYGYDTQDEELLFEDEFNTALNLHEVAAKTGISYDAWNNSHHNTKSRSLVPWVTDEMFASRLQMSFLPHAVPMFGEVRYSKINNTCIVNPRVQTIQFQDNFIEETSVLHKQKSPISRRSSPLAE